MKKTIIAVAVLFTSLTASAQQFYVSGNTGYSFGVGEKTLGDKTTDTSTSELDGSYGEGVHTQLRGGYLFNDKWGIELGLGYLHGSNQDVIKRDLTAPVPIVVDIEARGRAFGASLSAVYNFTENIYARAGYLTKIGGKTEAVGSVESAAIGIDLDFTTDFHGKFPSGFVGAVGYKFPIADNWSLFGEVEYMGINVTRDTSELSSATLNGSKVSSAELLAALNPTQQAVLAELLPLLAEESKWGEGSLPSSEAPYSSIGINFGVTYTFGK